MKSGKPMECARHSEPSNEDKVAMYIAELAGELSAMASEKRLSILAYILDMARREAEVHAAAVPRT